MASPLVLERTGNWAVPSVTLLLLLVACPGAPLLWSAVSSLSESSTLVGGAFPAALFNSAVVALLVVAVSFLLGLPGGVLLALYNFPGRGLFLGLLVLPLLVPSFLWAIGWSQLTSLLGEVGRQALSGFSGCVIVFSSSAVSLTLLASYVATKVLSASQVDSARIAGGEKTVLLKASRHSAVAALLASVLAGVLTLQDPGPGQIFGLKTAASEILTSFSALNDFALAGRQCAALTVLVLLVAIPLACFCTPRIAHQILARQTGKPRASRHRGIAYVACFGLGLIILSSVVLPLLGLTLPLFRRTEFVRAWSEVTRTAGNTLFYAAGAGIVSVTLALLLSFLVGRSTRLRSATIAAALILFSLPPALTALGIVQLAARAPAWADPFLRSRVTVCVALGLRFFPIAAVLSLRAWSSTSPSWTMVAAVHGVSLGKYFSKVLFPLLLPALLVAALLVSLLSTADVGTVLLLQPPGKSSFPLAIFTVMANAPEALVATLCLLYVAIAAGLLMAVGTLMKREVA